jgi:hypothetical protein
MPLFFVSGSTRFRKLRELSGSCRVIKDENKYAFYGKTVVRIDRRFFITS